MRRREQKQKDRELRRNKKQLEKLQAEEQKKLQEKIKLEERKLLLAQRNLQSIRLIAELLSRAKVTSIFISAANEEPNRTRLFTNLRGGWRLLFIKQQVLYLSSCYSLFQKLKKA